MTAIKKVLAAALKDIGNILYMIGVGSASGSLREYSMAKVNFFYSMAEEDMKEWLAKINRMIEVNNVTLGRRVAVVAAHLRDIVADWYEADKANIVQYADGNMISFIRRIKTRFISDV